VLHAGNRLGTPHPLFLTPSTRPSDGSLTSPTLRVLYCPPHYIHLKKGGFGYIYINMKYIITESQDNKLVDKLTNSIKSDGWVNTAKLVGGDENLIKALGITSPMDFLHLFDDMNVVQSEKRRNVTLFRYNKGNDLMYLNKKNKVIAVNYDEIWSILEIVFELKYSEIQELIKEWLDDVYNLSGITPGTHLPTTIYLDEVYNLR
jgi:hypothetical protein